MAKKKIKNLTRTHTAVSTNDVIIDKNDSVGPYLLSISEFMSLFGFNATNYRVTEFASGGAQNASLNFDVYIFRAAGTLQLLNASTMNGQPVIVVNLSNGLVTVTPFSGQSIDAANSLVIKNSDSEQLIPASTGFVTTAKNKIRSRSELIAYFNANPTLVLDDGEQIFLRGSGLSIYKVGDGVNNLATLPWSNLQLSDYIISNDAAVSNKQDKLNGGVGYVYSNNGVITYVTIPAGGDISSGANLTPGYYTVSDGNKSIANGRIYQDANQLRINSPLTSNYEIVSNTEISLNSLTGFGTSKVALTNLSTSVSYYGSSTQGSFIIDNSSLSINSNSSININCNVVRLNNLTGDRVLQLSSAHVIEASAVTTTELSYLIGARSPLQPQIDAIASGISWKDEVKAATTANITLSGTQTVDGVALGVDDDCLVKNQTTQSQNGIYKVKSGAWVRRSDCDATSEIVKITVGVRLGGQKDTWWSCSNNNEPVVGTDAITFVQVPGAGAVYSQGAGISISGGVISIATGGVDNSMIANGTINLSTKVTNVLKYINGGTQSSTVPLLGALPYAGLNGYAYDRDNYNYDISTRTLNLNNLYISPEDGVIGLNIEAAKSNAAQFKTFSAGFDAVIIEAAGNGVKVDSAIGIAGRFSSTVTAIEANQYGIITGDVDHEASVVNRNFTRADASTAKATGPMHLLNDSSVLGLSTGSGYKYQKKDATGALIRRFETLPTGEVVFNTQTDIVATVSGTFEVDTTQSGTVGSTPKDVFTKAIKASHLNNVGDSIDVEYGLIYNEATKTKSFTVYFGGVTLFSAPAFAMLNSTGAGKIKVRIIKTGLNAISYDVEATVTDGADITSPVLHLIASGTATPTLTSSNTLRVNAACQAASANNGVVANLATYKTNPKV